MLPSHGQDTAAVKLLVTGQAGPPMFKYSRGDVFGKQARLIFAEFLPFCFVLLILLLSWKTVQIRVKLQF